MAGDERVKNPIDIEIVDSQEQARILEKVPERWKPYIERSFDVKPEPLDSEKIKVSEGIKLFRGTAVADILYAMIEKNGDLISPLSDTLVPGELENNIGTILTSEIGEAINQANIQLEIRSGVTEQKVLWLSRILNLEPNEVIKIGGLWQPILLEITNKIPGLQLVEYHENYFELWTRQPVNIFAASLSGNTLEELIHFVGPEIISSQLKSATYVNEQEIDFLIKQKRRVEAERVRQGWEDFQEENSWNWEDEEEEMADMETEY